MTPKVIVPCHSYSNAVIRTSHSRSVLQCSVRAENTGPSTSPKPELLLANYKFIRNPSSNITKSPWIASYFLKPSEGWCTLQWALSNPWSTTPAPRSPLLPVILAFLLLLGLPSYRELPGMTKGGIKARVVWCGKSFCTCVVFIG